MPPGIVIPATITLAPGACQANAVFDPVDGGLTLLGTPGDTGRGDGIGVGDVISDRSSTHANMAPIGPRMIQGEKPEFEVEGTAAGGALFSGA